jgi:hypothetical protein
MNEIPATTLLIGKSCRTLNKGARMAKGRAIAILPADAEKRELTAMTRKQEASQALVERAHIILVAASGQQIRRTPHGRPLQ